MALTGFCQRVQGLVHKGRGHQYPECIYTKILHKMELVSEKWKKQLLMPTNCNNSNFCPALRCCYLESITISLQNVWNVLISVPNRNE